jgi:hypothetical protein
MGYSFRECRKRLAILWLGVGGFLFVVMIAETSKGALSDRPTEAWGWFLPNVMPTLMLVASSLVGDANPQHHNSGAELSADQVYFKIAIAASAFYLALILFVLIGWRATVYRDPTQLMSLASLWNAPIQGITASVIAIFFKRSGGEVRRGVDDNFDR